jgi:hypothetical protein
LRTPRPTFRLGAITRHGPKKNTRALIAASGCRTGDRTPNAARVRREIRLPFPDSDIP